MKIIIAFEMIFVAGCATPLVVKTPNVTKPVHIAGGCDQNREQVMAEHKEGYSSDGDKSYSRTDGEESNLEMKIFTSDPADKKKTVIEKIEFGSFSYMILFVAGKKYWVNSHLAHCDMGGNK